VKSAIKNPAADKPKQVVFADEPHPERKEKPSTLAEGDFNEDDSHNSFM